MKIALDGQKLLIDKLAGPEVYTFNTFKALAEIDHQNEYIVYFDRKPPQEFWQSLTQDNKNFSYKVIPYGLSWTQTSLPKQLFKDKPDIFFNAKHTIPAIHPKKTKLVSTIHGLEFKKNKQYLKKPIHNAIHPFILQYVIRNSNQIIVPSFATKNAIIDTGWSKMNTINFEVVQEGIRDGYYKREAKEVNEMREKYKIGPNPYLLFVSTIQPRKNIPRMVHAFSNVVKNYEPHKNLKLLISGKLGWHYTESLMAPGKYDIAENIRFIGRTTDEDSAKLLSGATAHINCSLEEGFGLPLLEAMACETPSVVSDIPAFRELGQNTSIYVNPENIESIEHGILNVINSDQTEQIKEAKEIADNLTWETGAKKIIEIFDQLQR